MTREEETQSAIEWIESLRDRWNDKNNVRYCNMAIKALEQTEPEKCEDCISRQAVLGLKTIAPIAPVMNGKAVHYEEVVFVRDLEKLPSVEPERKTGKWIVKN